MRRFAVIDTNVVVAGLLSGGADGAGDSPTVRIVDAMLAGSCPFVLSESLLTEYREVLLRPAISARHGLTEAEVDIVLEEMVLNAGLREPARTPTVEGRIGAQADLPPAPVAVGRPQSTPPGDEHLIALLNVVPKAVLVTGDRRLAEAVGSWRTVATPVEFAATLPMSPDD